MKTGFLFMALAIVLSGCQGIEHSGCPTDLPDQNSNQTGAQGLLRTCN